MLLLSRLLPPVASPGHWLDESRWPLPWVDAGPETYGQQCPKRSSVDQRDLQESVIHARWSTFTREGESADAPSQDPRIRDIRYSVD